MVRRRRPVSPAWPPHRYENLTQARAGRGCGRILLLAALQSAMYARPAGGPTHFFYLDEFQHFARPDLVEFLSKAPAYNVGAVLANQNLAQLRQAGGQALQETVAANAGTTVLLRCDTPDAEAFADRLPAHHGRAWTPGALASLPFGVGVAHTQGGGGLPRTHLLRLRRRPAGSR